MHMNFFLGGGGFGIGRSSIDRLIKLINSELVCTMNRKVCQQKLSLPVVGMRKTVITVLEVLK